MSLSADRRRPRVFVARRIPDAGLAMILDACEADVWEDEMPPPRDELLRRVAGCEGVLTLLTDRVDDELLDAAGASLRVVSNYAVGFDNVDVPACTRRGIPVGNTPGALTETTADLAWALLMAGARRVAEGDRYVRAGRWRTWGPQLLLGRDVHGATIGVVGLGRIGQAVSRRAAGFGMTVLYWSRSRAEPGVERDLGATFVELEELLERSDFVTLHVSLNDETRHLIDAAALARMKPSAVLVNTARGPVVDQAALADALRDGTIAAAGLDVTDPEPIAPDDPLLELENCLVVPHIASASHATRGKMAEMAAANLLAGLRGERVPNPVNPEVYRD
ncbi:MAG TPA: D-glycerate dehydrogenase [Candidatus Limnocylindrales bacterium]|nr:D-glycerate dehydrogenase [Candidatus Limnocylindrales bacterium]